MFAPSIYTNTLIAFVAILLLSLSVSAQYTCPLDASSNQCSAEGECITFSDSNAFCACSSGTSGTDCGTDVDADCSFNSVTALETDNIPIATAASFTNDQLTVVVKSPLVTERRYTTIRVDEANGDNWNCTYPGQYWSRSFDGCLDQYTAVFPWADTVSGCGWAFDNSDSEYFTYNADMIIEHHDFIDPFAGRAGSSPVERITEHLVPLEVQFQKFVDVSTEIVVNAPVTVLAVITRQSVDPDTKEAIIEVTTNLLWPYQLTGEEITFFPAEYDYSYSVTDISNADLCVNAAGESCTQTFRISMDASSGCEITGLYDLSFDVDCQLTEGSAPAECAIEDAAATLNLSIISEEFCAEVSVKVDITGTLTSYFDAAYTNPREQFLLDQVTYYEADISSPDATLTSAVISSVKLVDGATQTVLYASLTSLVAGSEFALDTNGSDFAQFYFKLSDAYLSGITEANPKSLSVVARVDVTFEGVPGSKRVTLQGALSDKTMAIVNNIGVQAAPSDEFDASEAVSLSLSLLIVAFAPLSHLFSKLF